MTYEIYQSDGLCGSCLDPDLNKTTVKKYVVNTSHFIFKELLILLSVILVL